MALDDELQEALNLQSAMRELQKSPGWDQFLLQTAKKRAEAVEDLLAGGAPSHDKYVGFIMGLDWVTKYPQFLVDLIQQTRDQIARDAARRQRLN